MGSERCPALRFARREAAKRKAGAASVGCTHRLRILDRLGGWLELASRLPLVLLTNGTLFTPRLLRRVAPFASVKSVSAHIELHTVGGCGFGIGMS